MMALLRFTQCAAAPERAGASAFQQQLSPACGCDRATRYLLFRRKLGFVVSGDFTIARRQIAPFTVDEQGDLSDFELAGAGDPASQERPP
jgi:hypothetical protein